MSIIYSTFSNTISTTMVDLSTGIPYTKQNVSDNLFSSMVMALNVAGFSASYSGYNSNSVANFVGGNIIVNGQNISFSNKNGVNSVNFLGYNAFGGTIVYTYGRASMPADMLITYGMQTIKSPNGSIYCIVQTNYMQPSLFSGTSFSSMKFVNNFSNTPLTVDNWISTTDNILPIKEYPNLTTAKGGLALFGQPTFNNLYTCADLICNGLGVVKGNYYNINNFTTYALYNISTFGNDNGGPPYLAFNTTCIVY